MDQIDWTSLRPNDEVALPRYAQLANAIADLVERGALRAGDQLPAERELAAATGMSRMTARQGLQQLARDGVVTVRHGVGVFITEACAATVSADSWSLPDTPIDGEGKTDTIEQHIVGAPAAVAAALKLEEGTEVVRIVRVRSTKTGPYLLHICFLPAARFPGLAERDLGDTPVHDVLRNAFGIEIGIVTQTIESAVAGAYQRRWLDLDSAGPLLTVDGVIRDTFGSPVEAFRATYRADHVAVAVQHDAATGSSRLTYRIS